MTTTKKALLAEFLKKCTLTTVSGLNRSWPVYVVTPDAYEHLSAALDRVERETWQKAVDVCFPNGKESAGEILIDSHDLCAARDASLAAGHDLPTLAERE